MRATVDDEDYEELSRHSWTCAHRGATYYVQRGAWENGKRKTVYMHRVILGVNDPRIFVDHIDRNALNNQRENLRLADSTSNKLNQQKRASSHSIYKGVSYLPAKQYWMAKVAIHGKTYFLGTFEEEWDAAVAYNAGARHLHGPFAVINERDKEHESLLPTRSIRRRGPYGNTRRMPAMPNMKKAA